MTNTMRHTYKIITILLSAYISMLLAKSVMSHEDASIGLAGFVMVFMFVVLYATLYWMPSKIFGRFFRKCEARNRGNCVMTDDKTLQKIQVLKQWDKEHNFGLFRKYIDGDVVDMKDDREVLNETWFSHATHYNIESVPSEIEVLQKLERFWLQDVGLKSLPDSICKIQSIEEFSVSRNTLQEIPSCIGSIKEMKYFDIHNNNISSLPKSIGMLQELLMLRAESNNLSNIPESIGKLKKLDRLFLANNPIDRLPDSLQECTALETLDISGTNIVKPPKWLEEMPSLKKVIGFPKLTLYFQKHLQNNEYGQMQIRFRELFDQDLTEEEIAHKKGGIIGDECFSW